MPDSSPHSGIRRAIRAGEFGSQTASVGRNWLQANVAIVPRGHALAFATFCFRNMTPCPLLEITEPGDPHPKILASGADLRSDIPRYRVYREGQLVDEPTTIFSYWRDDLVAFLLGCSFTFEQALVDEGIRLRHLEEGRNVAMYTTAIPCRSATPFDGKVVVSMRPIHRGSVGRAIEISSLFPLAHGGPIAVGDPASLGISDLDRPDFGDLVRIGPDEVPVFWACGVTAELAAASAGLDLVITHSPGHMFITDWPHERAAHLTYRRMLPVGPIVSTARQPMMSPTGEPAAVRTEEPR